MQRFSFIRFSSETGSVQKLIRWSFDQGSSRVSSDDVAEEVKAYYWYEEKAIFKEDPLVIHLWSDSCGEH